MAKRPSMMVLRSLIMAKRPPSDEEIGLFGATVAVEGVTTDAGAGTGDSFTDAALAGAGDNSFVSMLAVLYPGDPRQVDSMDITAFNTVTGEVTLAQAYKGVAAAIPAGVPYKIVTFRFGGYAEPSATGATTGAAYIDALDIDARLYHEFTIKIKNTDGANSLDYRVLLRPEHGVADEMIQPEDITLAPAEYDFVNIDHKWGQVIVQVRDTVPASNADFSVYTICNKQ
jgi:hypothetical protein